MSPRTSMSTVENSPGLNRGKPRHRLTPNGYPVVQRSTMSDPATLPCPRMGIATNFVNAFISAASVSTDAEFMCLPRVIDRPIPKKMTPNLQRFIRSARSCNCSTFNPVSSMSCRSTRCPFTMARSAVIASKSLLGRTCKKISAALTLSVSRMSTRTIVRPLRPSGTNLPFCMIVYFVKCRGWHSAGLPPQ